MTCVPATDEYLIAAFPGVVLRTRERWVVKVIAAAIGEYDIEMVGASFPYDGLLGDTVLKIRNALLFQLGGQPFAAAGSLGADSIQIEEVGVTGLGITVSGPAPDTISATLVSGGDSNATFRQFWLDRALCGLPPCCVFTCIEDYTLMHAALAAHWIYTMSTINGSGGGANDFIQQRLGPASLTKGKNVWSANPADSDLAQTIPGQLYLQLRARYVFGIVCA